MPHTFAFHRRRGALLLLVLGVLTMFVLVGTVMLTLATRARSSSRAFAAATAGTAAGPMLARVQLEQALLQLIRGGANAKTAGLSESLLEDMYGSTPAVVATVTSIQDRGVIVEATLTPQSGTAPIRAADLCGRVLTFTPSPASGDSITSQRILRASPATSGTGAFTCWMAKLPSEAGGRLPQPPCRAVVNQPAFRDEAYDAYDPANPWLTRVSLENGSVKSVPRPAFASAGAASTVDNDNDGVDDGVWLSGLLSRLPAPDGGTLTFDVSYLVLDLDGRINVNAHGNRTSIDFPASGNWWKNAPAVPTGSGYGPADIDASLVLVDPLQKNQTASDPPVASDRWRRVIGGTAGGLKALVSSTGQRRPVAQVGMIDGRYGDSGNPGGSGNDSHSARNELLYGNNPLVDLKCMIKAQMDTASNSTAAVPKMIYYCPDWTKSGYVDDPYEMRLDVDAQRPVALRSGTNQIDNPFTVADMEAVLRQFDADAATLPPRLAVALDNASQRSRMLLTTDSWDTPGLTGTTAATIENYVARLTCDPADVMSPDVLAGLRFDINRPFPADSTEAAAKQDYCKHLYTLLVALGQPATAATAQWAANVVDYRDPDSKFTRFQFDTTPADGWNKTTTSGTSTVADPGWNATNVVWGVERPELVIAQTLAWRDNLNAGELFVSLHRPWSAVRVGPDGKETAVDVLDPSLASKADANTLDLSMKVGNDPIWRLRFDEDSKFVRFDTPAQNVSLPAFPAGSTTFTSNDKSLLAPNSYLVVKPNGNSAAGIKVGSGLGTFRISKGGTFRAERWSGAGNDQPGSDTMVFLDRLADPSLAWNAATNPYVTVDQLGIKLVNRSGVDPNNWRSFFRDPPFWRHRPFSKIMKPPTIAALDPQATNWLPWANRAYISHAELLLVPQGNALQMMTDYDIPKNKKATNPYYSLPTEKLLDAAIVPSRFAGSQVSVLPAALTSVGMDKIPFNQLSRWREPGRVNLNTVTPNRSCSDPQSNDSVWWAALGPDASVSLDEFASAGPATNIGDLLTLMQGGGVYIDADDGSSGNSCNSSSSSGNSSNSSSGNGNSWKKNRPYDLNPAAAYTTAMRLANVATIRSHVFAVWVTVRVRNTSAGGSDSYHRLFAIIDRSRPVGFSVGQDLNVRDTIRVLRFLE